MYAEALAAAPGGVRVSTRGRWVGRSSGWGGREQKKTRRAAERDAAAVDPDRLVVIDESAALTTMVPPTPAARAARACGAAPRDRWRRLTVITVR